MDESVSVKGRKPQFSLREMARIRHMYEVEDMRHHEIARIMGTSKGTIQRYLSGGVKPRRAK